MQSQYVQLAERLIVSLRVRYSLPERSLNSDTLELYATKLQQTTNLSALLLDEIRDVRMLMDSPERISSNDYNVLQKIVKSFQSDESLTNGDREPLVDMFSRLSLKSSEALVDGNNKLDSFHQYLHVARPIERELEDVFDKIYPRSHKTLTLIVGNVGDGKSYLLSYERAKLPEVFLNYNIQIHNDATESNDPDKTALETLTERLQDFSDAAIDDANPLHYIVAINMGVLTSLEAHLKKCGGFGRFLQFLNRTRILTEPGVRSQFEPDFQLLTFHDSEMVKFTQEGAKSEFLLSLLCKITKQKEDNPFWRAYKQQYLTRSMVTRNYELLQLNSVQRALEQLIIRIQVQYNQIISTRLLLNFIHDIVIPPNKVDDFKALLPMLLFSGENRSLVLKYVAKLDPTLNQNVDIDKYNARIFNTMDYRKTCESIFHEQRLSFDDFNEFFTNIAHYAPYDDNEKVEKFHRLEVQCLVRTLFILKPEAQAFSQPTYSNFLNALASIDKREDFESILGLVVTGMVYWNGRVPLEDYSYSSRTTNDLAIKLDPQFDEDDPLMRQGYAINVCLVADGKRLETLIDFNVYSLLCKIQKGYLVRDVDINRCVEFDRLVQKFIHASQSRSVIVRQGAKREWFQIQRKYGFGNFSVEVLDDYVSR